MSDELRNIYEAARKLGRFFETTTPVALFRGKKADDPFDMMYPTLIGWMKGNGEVRVPDVLLNDASGQSPQYQGGRPGGRLVEEPKNKPRTAQIVADASTYVVKGCRTIKGDHRGVSVFDMANKALPNFEWFRIRPNTTIPPGLAVTRDVDTPRQGQVTHYTIAPKDDMPLPLFLQHLKGLAAAAEKI